MLDMYDLNHCEQVLEETMNVCDSNKRERKGQELTGPEKDARDKRRAELGKEYSDSFSRENKKELQRIKDKILRGR